MAPLTPARWPLIAIPGDGHLADGLTSGRYALAVDDHGTRLLERPVNPLADGI